MERHDQTVGATAASHTSPQSVRELMQEAASAVGGHKLGQHFLLTEWEQVVDAWQLKNWEAYRDVVRLGRKTRLLEPERAVLWSIFERVRAGLQLRQLITYAESISLTISKGLLSRAGTL